MVDIQIAACALYHMQLPKLGLALQRDLRIYLGCAWFQCKQVVRNLTFNTNYMFKLFSH